jgi:hypothetical protein
LVHFSSSLLLGTERREEGAGERGREGGRERVEEGGVAIKEGERPSAVVLTKSGRSGTYAG